MKFSARLGAALVGLIVGGTAALATASPAAATIPNLSSIFGGGKKGGYTYNNGNCGTLEIIKKLGLNLSAGQHMSMWDMPDYGDVEEITAEVDTDGDGASDKKIKVGKDRLGGKQKSDGVWGGTHMDGGKKKYWLASSHKSWNIVKSYATKCRGVSMYVVMNCVCGYGLLDGWFDYSGGKGGHDKGYDKGYDRDKDYDKDYDRDEDYDRGDDYDKDRDYDDNGKDDDNGDDGEVDCTGIGNCPEEEQEEETVTPVPSATESCVDTGKGVVCDTGKVSYVSGSSSDNDDELPVTGLALGSLVGLGVLLASSGAMAVLVTRRRRAALAGDKLA
ncbi:MAG TPA: hypothetical protein VFY17_02355 [Pilimelia sp.]|nr:hypothetical protein [Pilimelia sp.]